MTEAVVLIPLLYRGISIIDTTYLGEKESYPLLMLVGLVKINTYPSVPSAESASSCPGCNDIIIIEATSDSCPKLYPNLPWNSFHLKQQRIPSLNGLKSFFCQCSCTETSDTH